MNTIDIGQQRIGNFNSEGRADVDVIKRCAAELINHMVTFGKNDRRTAIAIDGVEAATMMAIKSIFTEG